MKELIEAIPRCHACGRRDLCPCLLLDQGRIDDFHAWHKEEFHPPERFLLGEFGDDGSVRVELVLAAKSGADRYVERPDVPLPEVLVAPIPRVKRVTAKREEAAQAKDAVALKERPESADEFRLTSPSEKDLKKMKRRR